MPDMPLKRPPGVTPAQWAAASPSLKKQLAELESMRTPVRSSGPPKSRTVPSVARPNKPVVRPLGSTPPNRAPAGMPKTPSPGGMGAIKSGGMGMGGGRGNIMNPELRKELGMRKGGMAAKKAKSRRGMGCVSRGR